MHYFAKYHRATLLFLIGNSVSAALAPHAFLKASVLSPSVLHMSPKLLSKCN